MPDEEFHDAGVFVDRLADAAKSGRDVVFLVGAPLTAPIRAGEPGVPAVDEMVRRARAVLGRAPDDGPSGAEAYQKLLKKLLGGGPREVERFVKDSVLRASTLDAKARQELLGQDDEAAERIEEDPAAWHLSPGVRDLGQLVAATPQGFGCKILTTNFDPLIQVAIRAAGGTSWRTVLDRDGSFLHTEAQGCHVVHGHGYWRGPDTLHTSYQLGADRPRLMGALRELLRDRELAVVAYGGWGDVFTQTLTRILTEDSPLAGVMWSFYESEPEQIRESHGELLDALAPGLKGRVQLYRGVDAHQIFGQVLRRSGLKATSESVAIAKPSRSVFSSPFVVGAPILRDEEFFGRFSARTVFQQALDPDKPYPVEILGERRMGKTSMLRWVERNAAVFNDRPVVYLSLQGLAGHSPTDLVREVATAVGRVSEVEDFLDDEDAIRALDRLLPLVLLVDEGEVLLRLERGFDDTFLEGLRAAGQEGELVWMSTSRDKLHPQLRSAGRTSLFLNDSAKVVVGALESEAVSELLEPLPSDVDREDLVREAGRIPILIQTAGQLAWQGLRGEDFEYELEDETLGLLEYWWKVLGPEERGILARAEAHDRSHATVRQLERRGLLEVDDGRPHLPGRLWERFVRDV